MGRRQELSDAELLRTGDAEAFCVIYDRYVGELYRWAHARVGDDAADLTAEVLSRAWIARRRFRDEGDGSAAPWLYGIALNVLRTSLRKRRMETSARARLGLPLSLEHDAALEDVERRLSLPAAALDAVRGLPERDRELLLLRIVEERPYREIASRLQCTPLAARLRVSRALRRLHTELQGDL